MSLAHWDTNIRTKVKKRAYNSDDVIGIYQVIHRLRHPAVYGGISCSYLWCRLWVYILIIVVCYWIGTLRYSQNTEVENRKKILGSTRRSILGSTRWSATSVNTIYTRPPLPIARIALLCLVPGSTRSSATSIRTISTCPCLLASPSASLRLVHGSTQLSKFVYI